MSTTSLMVGAETFSPVAVETVNISRAGGVLVHEVLGRADPDITIRPAGVRTGVLALTFADEAAGKAAMDALAVAGLGQIASSSSALTMAFVVPAGQSMSLTREPAGHWSLAVPVQEVYP